MKSLALMTISLFAPATSNVCLLFKPHEGYIALEIQCEMTLAFLMLIIGTHLIPHGPGTTSHDNDAKQPPKRQPTNHPKSMPSGQGILLRNHNKPFFIQLVSIQSLSCAWRHVIVQRPALPHVAAPLCPYSHINSCEPTVPQSLSSEMLSERYSGPTNLPHQPLCQRTLHGKEHREHAEGGHGQRRVRRRGAVLLI